MMIGLDIGTDVIRACLFEGSFGRYTFSKTLEEPLPRSSLHLGASFDMDDDTEEVDPAILAQADLERRQSGAIHALLRGYSNAAVVTHQPATQVSLRTVSLPFTDSNLIAEALPATVEEMVPFDIDELQIQHQILSIDTESQVLVLITREDIIESHLDKLEGLGINPQHILVTETYWDSIPRKGFNLSCISQKTLLHVVSIETEKHWDSERWSQIFPLWKQMNPHWANT